MATKIKTAPTASVPADAPKKKTYPNMSEYKVEKSDTPTPLWKFDAETDIVRRKDNGKMTSSLIVTREVTDTSTGKKYEIYKLVELNVKGPPGRVLFSSLHDLGEKPKPKDGSSSDDLKASYGLTYYQDPTITCDPSVVPAPPGKIRISLADFEMIWKKSMDNLRIMVDGDIEYLLDNKDCYPAVYEKVYKQAKEEMEKAKFENTEERRVCMRRLYKARYSKHFTEENEYLEKKGTRARSIAANRQPFRKMSDEEIAKKKPFKDAYPDIQKTLDDNDADDPYLPLARICQQQYANNFAVAIIPCDYCIGRELVNGVVQDKYQQFHAFDHKVPVGSVIEPTLFINSYNNLSNLGQLSVLGRVRIYKFEPYAERAMKRSEPSFECEPEALPEAPVHPSKRKAAEMGDASPGEYMVDDGHDGASSTNKRTKTSTEDYDTYAGSN
jgi:hypothetical protein